MNNTLVGMDRSFFSFTPREKEGSKLLYGHMWCNALPPGPTGLPFFLPKPRIVFINHLLCIWQFVLPRASVYIIYQESLDSSVSRVYCIFFSNVDSRRHSPAPQALNCCLPKMLQALTLSYLCNITRTVKIRMQKNNRQRGKYYKCP